MSSSETQKIEIQFVLPATGLNRIGGMEIVAVKLLTSLDPNKYVVSLICFDKDNGAIARLAGSGIPVTVISKRAGLDPTLVPRLACHFARTRPHIIHTFNEGALIYAFPAALLARVEGVVHAEHGRLPVPESRALRGARIAMTRGADRVIAVSEGLREKLVHEEEIPEEKVSLIINGVDLAPFGKRKDRSRLRRRLGIAPGDWAVGAVGSLSPQKNHELLIRAAAKVPGIRVLIAGSGPLEPSLNEVMSELGTTDRMRCVGALDDVPAFLAALDLFVLPSVTEGTALALLEAMAARLPVVATDVGGNRDVVRDGTTGLLTPSGDVAAMAEKLAWCASHRDRCKAMGREGRARVESDYDFQQTVAKYDGIFRLVLERKRSQGRWSQLKKHLGWSGAR